MRPKWKFKGRSVSDEGVEIYLWDINDGEDQGWAAVDWLWRDPHVEYQPGPAAVEPVPVSDVLVDLYALADPCTPNAECGHDKCKTLEKIRQNLAGIDHAMARVREWLEPVVTWAAQANQYNRDLNPLRNDIANHARAAMEPATGIFRASVLDYPAEEYIGPDGKTLWLKGLTNGES
jgi:hypothetical protein